MYGGGRRYTYRLTHARKQGSNNFSSFSVSALFKTGLLSSTFVLICICEGLSLSLALLRVRTHSPTRVRIGSRVGRTRTDERVGRRRLVYIPHQSLSAAPPPPPHKLISLPLSLPSKRDSRASQSTKHPGEYMGALTHYTYV